MNQDSIYKDLPLHLAVRKGHTDVALLLIKHGASVNHENMDAYLPIASYFDKDGGTAQC